MVANSITHCLRGENMNHNWFQCRRPICQIWCYRCKEYGHKANNCRGPNRGIGKFRNHTNQRPHFIRQNNKVNAKAVSQPTLQPLIAPSPKQISQFESMPDYIPLDVWNPYINFPTAHHIVREGRWCINQSTFEMEKYYREKEEHEDVVADARRRRVPHGKVTDESEKGYEGEDPGSFFKYLGKCGDDQATTGSCVVVVADSHKAGTDNELFTQNGSKRTQKWPIRPKFSPIYRRAKIFRPYGYMTSA